MLALLSVAELLSMSLWFAASAVAPELAARWELTPSQVGLLSTVVQIGFVAGTALAAILNLADTIPSRFYFAAAALLGAGANVLLLIAPGFEVALVGRFLTGACLAGVYPPAMKMIATWYDSGRGLAIGTIVGALTVGKAGPYLVHALPFATADGVVLSATGAAIAASVMVLAGYRDGPHVFRRAPFSWSLVGEVLRGREYRLALGGYLGHMWELYSYWVWVPAFLAAATTLSAAEVNVFTFATFAAGGIGCVVGGRIADRVGYARLTIWAMALSGTCALLTPAVFGGALPILVVVMLIWGASVVADSAQFSTVVTKAVPSHAVGTALTLQTSLGFLLTTVSIQAVPPVVAAVGWRWVFPMLAIGPVVGIMSMRRLRV